MNIQKIVFSNLDSANDNGAFEPDGYLYGSSASVIADDMVALASDCEDLEPSNIVEFVKIWLDNQEKQK